MPTAVVTVPRTGLSRRRGCNKRDLGAVGKNPRPHRPIASSCSWPLVRKAAPKRQQWMCNDRQESMEGLLPFNSWVGGGGHGASGLAIVRAHHRLVLLPSCPLALLPSSRSASAFSSLHAAHPPTSHSSSPSIPRVPRVVGPSVPLRRRLDDDAVDPRESRTSRMPR